MASGTTPICDDSTRKDDTGASGHGPPIVSGNVIGLITEAPDAPIYRDTGQWGKDSKPRAKRQCQGRKACDGPNTATCGGGNSGSKGGAAAYQYFVENGETLDVRNKIIAKVYRDLALRRPFSIPFSSFPFSFPFLSPSFPFSFPPFSFSFFYDSSTTMKK
jgi:hypothetical protein